MPGERFARQPSRKRRATTADAQLVSVSNSEGTLRECDTLCQDGGQSGKMNVSDSTNNYRTITRIVHRCMSEFVCRTTIMCYPFPSPQCVGTSRKYK